VVYQRRLLKQQHQTEIGDYQKELLLSNIKSQENERHRIATDLHDDIGAMLTTTKLYTDQIDITENQPELTALKDKTNSLIDETIDNVRRISLDLRPAILENFGLTEAILGLSEQVNQTGEIKVLVDYDEIPRFQYEKELALYRIIKELINNTLKHARASTAKIGLKKENDKYVLLLKMMVLTLSQH